MRVAEPARGRSQRKAIELTEEEGPRGRARGLPSGRWDDGTKVEGQPLMPPDPPQPDRGSGPAGPACC